MSDEGERIPKLSLDCRAPSNTGGKVVPTSIASLLSLPQIETLLQLIAFPREIFVGQIQ